MRPLLGALWRLDVTGLEHVPRRGPAVLCPNHISFIDSTFMMALAPRRMLSVGKAEYMDSAATRYLFPAMGMIPIDRSGGAASQLALDRAAEALARGDLFLIYPEGTRSRDGYLHRGRTGAVRLAVGARAPIIPVGIRGTAEVQAPDSLVPRAFRRVAIRYGEPFDASARCRGRQPDRALLRELTDELMFEIAELSGQEYRDSYGPGDP